MSDEFCFDSGLHGKISIVAAQTYVTKAHKALEKVRRAREGVIRARKEEEERMRQPCAICFESLAAWSELESVVSTQTKQSVAFSALLSSLNP